MPEKIQELRAEFTADTMGLRRGIGKAQGMMTNLGNRVGAIGQSFTRLGKTMLKWGAVATGVFSAVGAGLVKLGMTFETEMAEVHTLLTDMTEEDFKKMSDSVLNLSMKMGKATSDLSGGLYEVVSATVDAANQMKVLELAAKAGTAGMAGTKESVKLISAVIKGYGKTWEETESVLDKAFMTVKLGQTTFAELAAALPMVIPIAAQLGITFDELSGAYATLTGVTGNTMMVTTQISGVLRGFLKMPGKLFTEITRLTKAKIKGIEVDEETGENIGDLIKTYTNLSRAMQPAQIRTNGLVETMRTLVKATGGSEAQILALLGRAEGLAAIFALTGNQADTMRAKTEAMGNSAGAMTRAYEIIAKTFRFSWNRLTKTVIAMGKILGTRLMKELLPVVKSIREWIFANRELIKQNFNKYIDKLVDSVKKFWVSLKKIPPFLKPITDWMKEYKDQIIEIIPKIIVFGPILLIAAGAALILAGKIAIVGSFLLKLGSVLMGVIAFLGGPWTVAIVAAGVVIWALFGDKIMGAFKAVHKYITAFDGSWAELWTSIVNTARSKLQEWWSAFLAYMGPQFIKTLEGIWSELKKLWSNVSGIISKVTSKFNALGGDMGGVFSNIMKMIANSVKFMITKFLSLLEWVDENWPEISEIIVNAITFVLAAFNVLVNFIKWMQPFVGKVFTAIVAGIRTLADDVISIFGLLKRIGTTDWRALWSGIYNTTIKWIDKVTGKILKWYDWIKDKFGTIRDWMINVFDLSARHSPSVIDVLQRSFVQMRDTITSFGNELAQANLAPVITAAIAGGAMGSGGAVTDNRRVDMNVTTDVDIEVLKRAIEESLSLGSFARRGI